VPPRCQLSASSVPARFGTIPRTLACGQCTPAGACETSEPAPAGRGFEMRPAGSFRATAYRDNRNSLVEMSGRCLKSVGTACGCSSLKRWRECRFGRGRVRRQPATGSRQPAAGSRQPAAGREATERKWAHRRLWPGSWLEGAMSCSP
jgi:hypothetical protein